jgi:glycosyltransferase involved in cell wall biosynthesis
VVDSYPPMRSSCASQIKDLAVEMVQQGCDVTVMTPDSRVNTKFFLEEADGVKILRVRAPQTKDIHKIFRALNEFLMPFVMWKNFKQSPLKKGGWDAVVWYSPTIFFGPLISKLKHVYKCKTYLILRDIFPEWTYDLGIVKKGFTYWMLRAVAFYQYSLADIIGVQSPGNLHYFEHISLTSLKKIEVLNNWLDNVKEQSCPININDTKLAGKIIFIYAGNMGVAQGMSSLVELIDQFRSIEDVGFILIGRGSEFVHLEREIKFLKLENVLMYKAVEPGELHTLFSQCDIGLVWLDQRHKTHNIPGKFLSYMQAGLPVLANINPGNDLEAIIRSNDVGEVCITNNSLERFSCATFLINKIRTRSISKKKSLDLFKKEFTAGRAATQIISGISGLK